MAFLEASIIAGAMMGDDVGVVDLAITDVTVQAVRFETDRLSIEFTYRIVNLGSYAVDLEGDDRSRQDDNVAVQTYLSESGEALGPLLPAAGSVIVDPPVLQPGESYTGSYTANTGALTDPYSLGNFQWLVVDINGFDEPPGLEANNRAVGFIPAPSACTVGFAGTLMLARRRRSE